MILTLYSRNTMCNVHYIYSICSLRFHLKKIRDTRPTFDSMFLIYNTPRESPRYLESTAIIQKKNAEKRQGKWWGWILATILVFITNIRKPKRIFPSLSFRNLFAPYFFNYTLSQDPKDFHRLLKRVILLSKVFTKSNKKKMK